MVVSSVWGGGGGARSFCWGDKNVLEIVAQPCECSFLKDFYLFLERGEEREKEGEKHQCVVASRVPPTGDLAHNQGRHPDWESNQ